MCPSVRWYVKDIMHSSFLRGLYRVLEGLTVSPRKRCLTVLSEDIGVKIILWVLEENSTNKENLLKTNHYLTFT